MARKWFVLSPAGALLLLMGVALQALPLSRGTTYLGGTGATTERVSFGLPPSVLVTWYIPGTGRGSARRTVDVEWQIILPVLAVLYLASAAAGRAVTAPGRPWRPVAILLVVVGLVGAVAFAVAVGFSRYYWGYFLSRPDPDRRIFDATRVVSATPVYTFVGEDGTPRLAVDAPQEGKGTSDRLLRGVDEGADDPYYDLDTRVQRVLLRRGLLPAPEGRQLAPERLESLYARLLATGRIDLGGYPGTMELDGVVIEAAGPKGEPLLFVGVRSGAVSNDHHAYYEFLFSDPPGAPANSPPLSVKKFYYDVAGIEGIEWPMFALAIGVVGAVIAVPLALLVMAVRRWRQHRRSGARGFPVHVE